MIEKPQGKATPPRQRKGGADVQALARLLGQLGKVGGNLNQIAHSLNIPGGSVTDQELQAALRDLGELRTAILAAIRG